MAMAKTAEEKKYAAQERIWREDSDARTLGDAAAIIADPTRKAAAQRGAKRLHKDANETAKRATAQAAALKKVAAGKPVIAAKPAKAPARSKPSTGRKRR